MIYTLGHSTLSEHDFIRLVHDAGIEHVIDIRSHPTSKWPQFRAEALSRSLTHDGIKYSWWPALGGWTAEHYLRLEHWAKNRGVDLAVYAKGRFPKQRIAANLVPTDRPSWTNVGLRDYSYFMMLPEFIDGVKRLVDLGAKEDVGILCCEVLWWKCHRSMVSDAVVFARSDTVHVQPKRTLHSTAIGNRLERYDLEIRQEWWSKLV